MIQKFSNLTLLLLKNMKWTSSFKSKSKFVICKFYIKTLRWTAKSIIKLVKWLRMSLKIAESTLLKEGLLFIIFWKETINKYKSTISNIKILSNGISFSKKKWIWKRGVENEHRNTWLVKQLTYSQYRFPAPTAVAGSTINILW